MVKFTDGNWLVKEGYKISSPMVLHDFFVGEDFLELYVPARYINHRGDTLQGALFTIR